MQKKYGKEILPFNTEPVAPVVYSYTVVTRLVRRLLRPA